MKIEARILNEIYQFCKINKTSEYQFGLRAVGCHKLIKRLRDGREIRSGTINAIREYIAKHTPKTSK